MYSSSVRGRSPASNCASSSSARIDVTRGVSSVMLPARQLAQRLLQDGFEGPRLGRWPARPRRPSPRGADDIPGSGGPRAGRWRSSPPGAPASAPAAASSTRPFGSLSFSSRPIRSAVFFPTPGMAVSRADVARLDRAHQVGDVDAREHGERELRPDAADADQPLEDLQLERRREPVERERCLRARGCGRAAPRRCRDRRACRTWTAARPRRSRRRRRRR